MYAVAGTWTMDVSMLEAQKSGLPHIVEGVKRNPGFVRGYWASDVDDPNQTVTFIVFETLEQARRFRQAVIDNAPAQVSSGVSRGGLRIVEVQAEA